MAKNWGWHVQKLISCPVAQTAFFFWQHLSERMWQENKLCSSCIQGREGVQSRRARREQNMTIVKVMDIFCFQKEHMQNWSVCVWCSFAVIFLHKNILWSVADWWLNPVKIWAVSAFTSVTAAISRSVLQNDVYVDIFIVLVLPFSCVQSSRILELSFSVVHVSASSSVL